MMHVVEAGFERSVGKTQAMKPTNSRWEKERKFLFQEDFGHVLGNASRFSSTHANLLSTALKKKWTSATYKFTLKLFNFSAFNVNL